MYSSLGIGFALLFYAYLLQKIKANLQDIFLKPLLSGLGCTLFNLFSFLSIKLLNNSESYIIFIYIFVMGYLYITSFYFFLETINKIKYSSQ